MAKKIPHRTNHKHVTVPACIVWCFDPRFSKLLNKFIKTHKFKHYDAVTVAGGAKDLVKQGTPEQAYVFSQIEKSLKLHKPKTIHLMVHHNCGAYGQIELAKGQTEHDYLSTQAKTAVAHVAKFIESRGYKASVKAAVADFSGIHIL